MVYNHVYNGDTFCFNQIVPQYFSRVSDSGVYSAGSGCGNDTASERSMVSKYIVDSVKYWADEYHIDGENAGTELLGTAEGQVTVAPISAMVLVKETAPAGAEHSSALWLVPGSLAAAAAAAVVFVIKKRKK